MKLQATLLASLAVAMPAAAIAAPGGSAATPGASEARIVEPLALQPLYDLRFGTFIQPTTAGTVTVASNSTVSTTGGLDPAIFPTGRGASGFLVHGTANRQFVTFLPTTATVSNGTATMTIDNFRKNGGSGANRLDLNGYFVLHVGGRLTVNANQAPGNYSGTFTVSVLYN
ncbi:DUF4402 domain-containing protein [Erythrobacter mangrovi]|uniref:DUF4402 domain-containing protein n=1 Tax=Erythrobacter mangrovi TaxID=2739433 RepID=A0A7D4CLI1_9SPHN|nr:DUF4402 domain-containing protein [Erythrobacter mangrovi]QKG70608.1 DUF4402 domain-containing protein [Erythrobacter mangrovi]